MRIGCTDRIELAKPYGLAHRGLDVSTEVGTRFAIASGTKGLTALAVVNLAPRVDGRGDARE